MYYCFVCLFVFVSETVKKHGYSPFFFVPKKIKPFKNFHVFLPFWSKNDYLFWILSEKSE